MGRDYTLLASSALIKQYVRNIPENVDDSLISSTIEQRQEMTIRKLIGDDLFKQIQDEIDTASLTTENKTLLDDYILPLLSWDVYKTLIQSNSYQLYNNGLRLNLSETDINAEDSIVNKEVKRIESLVRNYVQKMVKYICDNSGDYPLYSRCDAYDYCANVKRFGLYGTR
jgi:hypothetical protein